MNEEKSPKKLPPSLRLKKRYIIFEVISEQQIEYGELVSVVWNSLLSLLGDAGASEARVWIIQNLYDNKNQRGVIRCKHDSVEEVRSSLALINIIGEGKVIIKILGVTGTIKSAKSKYLGFRSLMDFSGD
ncbi:MAG: ribonuclease P protein component 2 [Candidatus Aenigmarchaeota archaeon]|nr:ribonuclease P protein component 2 [Candidatus Aenigmarchaeota archaeon]